MWHRTVLQTPCIGDLQKKSFSIWLNNKGSCWNTNKNICIVWQHFGPSILYVSNALLQTIYWSLSYWGRRLSLAFMENKHIIITLDTYLYRQLWWILLLRSHLYYSYVWFFYLIWWFRRHSRKGGGDGHRVWFTYHYSSGLHWGVANLGLTLGEFKNKDWYKSPKSVD